MHEAWLGAIRDEWAQASSVLAVGGVGS